MRSQRIDLSELVLSLPVETQPDQRWHVLGPEAELFEARLFPAILGGEPDPSHLDGLLLAGALSARPQPLAWLAEMIQDLKEGIRLVVIDWQYDGPLNSGPELEQRVKKGQLCRLLRRSGFGQVDVITNQSHYYLVQAVKVPPAPVKQAGQYVKVAELKDLPKNQMLKVELFGHKIIVANTGKEIVAFARACPHADAPLERGLLRGRNVVCRSHGYIWNVCTGKPVEPEDEDLLRRYPVKVDAESGQVLVAIAP